MSSSLPSLSHSFSHCLSGPPLCLSTCASLLLGSFLCVCLSFSLFWCFFPCLSLSVSVSFRSRLGGEGNLLLTSTPPPHPSLPCPRSPGAPPPVPILYSLGRGPLSPWSPPWPHPLKVSPGLSLCWFLSPPFPTPVPASLLSFLCLCSSPSPRLYFPAPSLGSFLLPLQRPPPWLMPSLVLDNYQIYQWEERACVLCLLSGLEEGAGRRPLCWHTGLGFTLCQEHGLAPAGEAQDLRVTVKASSLDSTGDRRWAMGLWDQNRGEEENHTPDPLILE